MNSAGIAVWVPAALAAGSLVYCLLVVAAACLYRRVKPPPLWHSTPVSILKPLAGAEPGLEENLRGFFTQDYPDFEILFTVRHPEDPAVPVVEKLTREFPGLPARLMVTGEPPYPNHKVYCLQRMTEAARHSLLVMADSDIRVGPDFLRRVAAEFQDSSLALATCPYRAVGGPSVWSRLEAVGMNTEFLAGVLVARMIEGMRFAVGPTIVARREAILSIGGWERLKHYLAEDFVLGRLVADAGMGVALSSYVVEHRIGSQPLAANLQHRLRWLRSTRRSRPAGYLGQIFTNPTPLILLLYAVSPAFAPLCLAAMAARMAAAGATAWIVRDYKALAPWYLLSQDLLSFFLWIAGFFGATITWRGRKYHLRRDGRFEPLS